MGKVYALLVGINSYPSVPPLHGCLSDVERTAAMLEDLVPASELALETLTEADATHANIAARMRAHLGRAGLGDTAYFHFAGHGCQAGAAAEFKPFFASGKDEGLVCWDTSIANGMLLADKELAVLIAEIAANQAHVTVTLDCCHSGSGTRDLGESGAVRVRAASPLNGGTRAIETYADGHYARLLAAGLPLTISEGRHILLAACDRVQTAKEDTRNGGGLFTTALLECLRASGGSISYADLFRRSRAATRAAVASLAGASPQDPQFEPVNGFDACSGFLGRSLGDHRPRYFVTSSASGWQVECGAIHGLPIDSASPVTFNLFDADKPDDPAGSAIATRVLAQSCEVVPQFAAAPGASFMAELTSLPVPPLMIDFEGDRAEREALQDALAANSASPVALADGPAGTGYRLSADGERLSLYQGDRLIQYCATGTGQAVTAMLPALATVARWERLRALHNPRSTLDGGSVEWLIEVDGQPVRPDDLGRLPLDYAGQRRIVRFSAANRTHLPLLHATLVYFGNDFSIQVKRSEPIPGRSVALPEGGTQILHSGVPVYLDEGENRDTICFKLLVATDASDGFLLEQEGLAIGQAVASERGGADFGGTSKVVEQDWLTKDVTLLLIRTEPGA